jgi:hypothetical protein
MQAYFFARAVLGVNGLENGSPDLSTDVTKVAILFKILHD